MPWFLLAKAKGNVSRRTSSLIRHSETEPLSILPLPATVVLGALGAALILAVRLFVLLAPRLLAAILAAVALAAKTAHTDREDPAAPAAAPRDQLDQVWTRQCDGKAALDSSGGS
jgi:hypothetical protein